jgi:hypothetical protein
MFFQDLKDASPEQFKRATGVAREVFDKMVETYRQRRNTRAFGRPCRLTREEEVLVALMYGREYRTQFHIAKTYRVSEPTVWRIIRQVEQALLDDPTFHLPGRKALLRPHEATKDVPVLRVVVVDATECPIERPQKGGKNTTTAGKRSVTLSKRS